MIHSFSRFPGAALSAIALLPRWPARRRRPPRLDETLRESIERGCVGTQSVIITVAPGYREGLRQVLAAHGDVVTGEFPAIDAIAATVHCADLTTLAGFGSIRAVSTNATVGVSAVSAKTEFACANSKAELARELKKTEFATRCDEFRDIKPTS